MFFYAEQPGSKIIFMNLNMINDPPLEPQSYEAQAQFLKVLTHPARIAILDILRDGEHCVCHMEAHLGYRQAYISQQLMVLREAGLIQDRRDGWNIFYRVIHPQIYQVLDAVQKLTGQSRSDVNKSVGICTCPRCSEKTSRV
jgi:DNA-binding transcriptional ArsR family regulator